MSITLFLEQEREQQSGMFWDFISPSRLNLWLKCPLAFKRRYIDGWKSDPSPSLFIGKVVHTVLAHVYRHRIAGHICTAEEILQFVTDAWKLSMELEPPYFDDDVQEKKAKSQVLDLTTAYINSIPIQNERPVAIEKRYEVPLVDPATGENFDIPLVGIADLITEEEGGYVLVDFKTASSSSICEMQHELQLTAYAYILRSIIEEDELRCEVRQLVKTKAPKISVYRFPQRTDERFSRFFGLVREYLDTLDKGIFNYRPSFSCGMCEHNGVCCS
jgi:putative RecB family exonuclease